MTKTPDYEGLCEKLEAKKGMTVCPFDPRSPDYLTTPNDEPCKFCGGVDDGPDLCKGVDLRVMDQAAQAIRTLMGEKDALLASIDPETLEAIADEIQCFEHSARCQSLRGIAKRQHAAGARALTRGGGDNG